MARDDLVKQVESAFQDLQQSINGLTPEQMLEEWYDGWTVRDILGHIIGWHDASEDILLRMARGEPPVPDGVDYNDSDAWNARFAEAWRIASPESAATELIASQQRFVEAARHLPDEKFEEGRTADRLLLGNGAHHYNEHAAAILAWREKAGV